MSWSFAAKGQAGGLKKALAEYKNNYDINSNDPGIAMEGRHVEAARAIIGEAIDKIDSSMTKGGLIDVQASGSEWQGGVDLKISVVSMGALLMNPEEESLPKPPAQEPPTEAKGRQPL